MNARREIVALGLTLLLFRQAFAQGSEDPRAKAKELFDEAEVAYKLQHYDEALKDYEEAYRVLQAPELLFNIGQCYRLLGKDKEALKSYQEFLKEVPGSPYEAKTNELIKELDEKIAAEDAAASAETGRPRYLSRALYLGAGGAAAAGLVFGATSLKEWRAAAGDHPVGEDGDLTEGPVDFAAELTKAKARGLACDVLLAGGAGLAITGYLVGRGAKEKGAALLVTPTGLALAGGF